MSRPLSSAAASPGVAAREPAIRRVRRRGSFARAATRVGPLASLIALVTVCVPAAEAQAPDPDLNNDGVVNILDVSMVSSCFGQDPASVAECAVADTDADGDVDMDDVNYVLAAFGQDGFPVEGDNEPPIARAGPDQATDVGATVTLDGSASSDADGDLLSYSWSLRSIPPASAAVLGDSSSVRPTFLVDVPGNYVAELVVNDASVDSAPDSVVVSTENVSPVADAGPDQSATIGDTVFLDGSGSHDADGDLLTHAWSFESVPAASAAALSDASAVGPSFFVDAPGDYVARLIVNDGSVDSDPDTVIISTANTAPVADAGSDQSAFIGDRVLLDGGRSSDADGDLLTYSWSFLSVPAGSAAMLTDANKVQPSFEVDAFGIYVVQLIVGDGTSFSEPDTVVVSTSNTAPVADAGPDATARVGEVVTLDGSASSDAELDPLTYRWMVTSRPPLSTSTLSDASAVTPTLAIDRPGTYVVQLVVNDGQADSAPDEAVITTVNSRPVADPGEDQTVHVGETVELDGTGSSDADFDPLGYAWAITAAPPGSAAALDDVSSATPSLVPDLIGTYVVQLVVNDGTVDSAPVTVTVEALAPAVLLHANPTRGSVPLEVSLSAETVGGFPPYAFAWDVDGDSVVDDTRAGFVHLYRTGGTYRVSVEVVDARGFTARAEQVIEALVAPVVVASASPSSGPAPLDVAFSAVASDADGSIVLFEWDFNGDGVVDQRNPSTASGAFRYETPGRYEATLTVTDDDGASSSDTVVVSVGVAPVLDAAVSPLSGDAPLAVTFTASADDPDGVVTLYEWDFEGDGLIDYDDPAVGDTTHTYETGGVYPARVNVYDNDGLLATRTFVVSVAGPPVALPRAYPMQGEAPLTVTFFSDAVDIDGSPEFYDWDFDGDGTRDVRLIASMNTTYTYTEPGTYTASLTVEDNDGLTGTATVQIDVRPAPGTSGKPQAHASASPNNGGAPLLTSLIGEATDPDGAIVEYAWDFENDGTFDFTEKVDPSPVVGRLIDVGSYATPALTDVDGDGDRDLAIGSFSGVVLVYPNLGGPTAPMWGAGEMLQDESGANIDVGDYAAPAVEDVDGDGDDDLLIGNSAGQVFLVENVGGAASPAWVNQGVLRDAAGTIIDVGSHAKPAFFDQDGDGDRDLLIGESQGHLTQYTRSGPASAPEWTRVGFIADDTGVAIDVGSLAAPLPLAGTAPDENELLVGNSFGQITRFVNVGTATAPVWRNMGALQLDTGNPVDVGGYAVPVVWELFGDDETRLLVGDSTGRLTILTQTGAGWERTATTYNSFDVGNYSDPALADLDGDGDLDLLVGNSVGQIYLRENIGSPSQAAWFPAERLVDDADTLIDVGSFAAPTVGDFDADGDADLIVGTGAGQMIYVRNDGDASGFEWVVEGALVDGAGRTIDIGASAAPSAEDFDLDGDLDLLAGNSNGRIWHYRNDGDVTTPVWTLVGTLQLDSGEILDVGGWSQPALHDSDGNGTLDLLVGNSSGLIFEFENLSRVGFMLAQIRGPYDGLDVGTNSAPAVGDIDEDWDLDLFAGHSVGIVNLYPTYGQVRVTYPDPGVYSALLRVTDDAGESATDSASVTVLATGSPSAVAGATPTKGNVPLEVQFSADATDPDGTVVLYEWDFEGDGVFEYSSAAGGETEFTYTQAGTYDAVLRVTDDSGVNTTDTVSITADFVLEPSVATIAFNPSSGEVGRIQTVIDGGEALVTIRILDGRGNVVRTLVNAALRGPGTYEDPWSGTDQDEAPVLDGPYYVVVEYTVDGETTVIDRRDETAFEEVTPSRSFSSGFNPYAGEPVTVTYSIPWQAEVSLYFWTRDTTRPGSSIAPVRTLFLREARPPGRYSDVWDGFDDNGVVVDPGRQYPVTLWLYRLPDNAILVTGNRPEITSISVDPRYLTPSYNPYASGPPPSAVVTLETTKDATLEAQIVNQDALVVRRITRPARPAGLNTLTWDGRDSEGNLVAPGTYSIGVVAIDAIGNRSLARYAAVTVRY